MNGPIRHMHLVTELFKNCLIQNLRGVSFIFGFFFHISLEICHFAFFKRSLLLPIISHILARCQLFLRTFDFKVHGIGTPAGKADLQANDAIKYVDDKDVTDMTHDQVVKLIKNHCDLEMKIIVERYFYLIRDCGVQTT